MSLIPCACQSLKLLFDDAVNIGVRIENQDPTVAETLLKLTADLQRYRKKDRKIILDFLVKYMRQNVSIIQSLQTTQELPLPIIREDEKGDK